MSISRKRPKEEEEEPPPEKGDYIRAPRTGRWRRVLRVYRRKDGVVMVVVRTSKAARALGLPERRRLAWAWLVGAGVEIKK